MKLRTKTGAILIATTTAMVLSIAYYAHTVIRDEFLDLEHANTERNVGRVLGVLSDRVDALAAKTGDWAYWDDTHEFIVSGDPAYVEANLVDEFFSQTLLINCALFINNERELVYGKAFDLKAGAEIPVPQGLLAAVKNDPILLRHPNLESFHKGFLLTDESPVIVTSCPILTSAMEGPINGTLVFAVVLDDSYVDSLSQTLRMNITLHRLDRPISSEKITAAVEELKRTGEDQIIAPEDKRTISGYALLNDIQGTPVLLAQVSAPREIYAQGQSTLHYFTLMLIVAGLALAYVTLFLLGKTVLARLQRLSTNVNRIATSSDASQRVEACGNDELTVLAHDINRMLGAIEKAEKATEASEACLRTVLETAVDGIVTIDAAGTVTSFNKAAEGIFGYAAHEVVGQNVNIFMPEPYHTDHDKYMTAYMQSREPKVIGTGREVLGRKKDGTVFPIYLALSEVPLEDTPLFTGIIRDITEHKMAEERLKNAAQYDSLTGLMNRRFFDEELNVAVYSAKRHKFILSLCMVDVDEFKSVNDGHGHPLGDVVLAKLGEIIRQEIRRDDFAGRVGGDEFCICFSHAAAVQAATAVERIRQRFALVVFGEETGTPFKVTASFGIADLVSVDMNTSGLFEAADRALYNAKKAGRNRYAVNEEKPVP